MTVMQYANGGNLLSYLDQNIHKLTWMNKLLHLLSIAHCLWRIHNMGLVHCDLHGGNILVHNGESLICGFGLSRSMDSRESHSTILRGALRKFSIPANLLRNQTYILLVSSGI